MRSRISIFNFHLFKFLQLFHVSNVHVPPTVRSMVAPLFKFEIENLKWTMRTGGPKKTKDEARALFNDFLKDYWPDLIYDDPEGFQKKGEAQNYIAKEFDYWIRVNEWDREVGDEVEVKPQDSKRDEIDVGNIYQDKLERVMSKKFL